MLSSYYGYYKYLSKEKDLLFKDNRLFPQYLLYCEG